MNSTVFNVALEIWDKYGGNLEKQSELNYEFIAELKKNFQFLQAGDYFYYIFNVRSMSFEFMSPSVENILGYPASKIDLEFIFNLFHPDDQVCYVNFENEVGRFLHSLPPEKMFLYKVRMNFRLMKSDGSYLSVFYQNIAIQQDENGKILKSLGVITDISHLNPDIKPKLSFIGLQGETNFIDVQIEKKINTSEGNLD